MSNEISREEHTRLAVEVSKDLAVLQHRMDRVEELLEKHASLLLEIRLALK